MGLMERTGHLEKMGLMERTEHLEKMGLMERKEHLEKMGLMERTEHLEKMGLMERMEHLVKMGLMERTEHLERMVLMDLMEHLASGAFQALQALQDPLCLKQTKDFQELKRFQHRRSRTGSATTQNAPKIESPSARCTRERLTQASEACRFQMKMKKDNISISRRAGLVTTQMP